MKYEELQEKVKTAELQNGAYIKCNYRNCEEIVDKQEAFQGNSNTHLGVKQVEYKVKQQGFNYKIFHSTAVKNYFCSTDHYIKGAYPMEKTIEKVEKITEYFPSLTQEEIDNLEAEEIILECVNPKCREYGKFTAKEIPEEVIGLNSAYKNGYKGIRIIRKPDGELKADNLENVYKWYCSSQCAVTVEL